MRCLLDAIAVHANNSNRLVSIVLDGIPLSSKYLGILCCGLADNRILRDLSLSGCQIGDAGCDLLLGTVHRNPHLSTLNLSSCKLTGNSATFMLLFFKKQVDVLAKNNGESNAVKFDGHCDTAESFVTFINFLIQIRYEIRME